MAEQIGIRSPAGLLSDILSNLRFRSTIFFRSQLAAPWGVSLDEESGARFHISIDGGFWVGATEPSSHVEVGEMEIVILPGGDSHWIADRPGRPLRSSAKAQEACRLGSPLFQKGSITNLIMCGIARFDTEVSHPLLATLPSVIHMPRFTKRSRVWRIVELIGEEAEQSSFFENPILDRLTEALFLQLLVEVVGHGEETAGFASALRDPQLCQALELLHRQPSLPWTIDDLASRVALSRATLIRRFRESVGMPPIEYLSSWRLLKAHQLARYSADSIERIAHQVGFSSAQTLTRAFRRHFGIAPNTLRRSTLRSSASH